MIAILVCDRDEQECDLIARDCRRQVAQKGDESLKLEQVADDEALCMFGSDEKLINLLYYAFQPGQSLTKFLSFRKNYSDTMVMLLADQNVSPLEYLRPGVAPDSLLRPLDEKQLKHINEEFLESFFQTFYAKEQDSSFVVDTREEQIFIPYSKIYYFEARNKKLFVRTKHEEYSFYDTVDSLDKRLPDCFRRCHRSYIVNVEKIIRIQSAENYIELSDQLAVPLSRSYKSQFKGVKL